MKKTKQLLALLGIIILLGMYIATFFFAIIQSPNSRNWFMASVVTTIVVPVLLYGFMLVYRHVQSRAITIDTVVFDIGMVLVNFEPMKYLRSLGYDETTCEAVAKATVQSPEWNEWDRGTLSYEQYLRLFVDNAPAYKEQIERFLQDSYKTISPFDYAAGWLHSLKKKGYKIYLLSNYSLYMYTRNEKEMPFRKYVDGEVISYQVHQLKPNPEIYQTLFDTCHIRPSTSVFIDDRAENIQAAQTLGMHGIIFKDFENAVYELGMLGVK